MTSIHNSNGSYSTAQRALARVKLLDIAEMDHFGTLKWFDEDKRYGFIQPDSGGQDVFLHQSTVQLYGLRPEMLVKGVRVAFSSKAQPGRGAEATAIAIA